MKSGFTVELRSVPYPAELDDDLVERFSEILFRDRRLAGPVVTFDRALYTLEMRTSVDAVDIATAITTAKDAFEGAAEKCKFEDFDGRVVLASAWEDLEGIEYPDEIVNGGEVGRRLRISRERVRQLVSERPSRFPRPIAETERDRVWRWGDVALWARMNERKTKVPRRRRAAKVAPTMTETLEIPSIRDVLRRGGKKKTA